MTINTIEPKIASFNPPITIRRGTPADTYNVFNIFELSLADLNRRTVSATPTSAADPAALALMWEERRSLYEHLTHTADQFWLAERDGREIGFARSVVNGDVRELTEFFVLPGEQSSGVGGQLLARAFPAEGAAHRSIIATSDSRAQALYLKSGLYPRFPIYYFSRRPEIVAIAGDLIFERARPSPESLAVMGEIDEALLGHQRDADHVWLMSDRQGYLYYRDDRPVGYGYAGKRSGPFALFESGDFPAVLAHAETQVALLHGDHFGLEVPMINTVAVDYLLSRGFQIEDFMAIFMSDEPLGDFEHYIITSPPFIL